MKTLRKPKSQGVSVTTLMGYYDPENIIPSYIYPALHCAYANTYQEDSFLEISASRCYAEIQSSDGATLKYALRSSRANGATMNRFHINVASSFSPISITIYSDDIPVVTKELLPPSGEASFTVNGQTS